MGTYQQISSMNVINQSYLYFASREFDSIIILQKKRAFVDPLCIQDQPCASAFAYAQHNVRGVFCSTVVSRIGAVKMHHTYFPCCSFAPRFILYKIQVLYNRRRWIGKIFYVILEISIGEAFLQVGLIFNLSLTELCGFWTGQIALLKYFNNFHNGFMQTKFLN